MIAESIEDVIRQKVSEILNERNIPELKELVQTDNIGEVIEKLIILHIRMWMLEDKADITTDRDTLLDIEKKLDICFKQKRPKLVQAVNLLIDNAVRKSESLVENSVKYYEGYQK
jgi:hypothetical protein